MRWSRGTARRARTYYRTLFACFFLFDIMSVGCLAQEKIKGFEVSQKVFQNRLANEKSPYLLQHANNPVDWYPWGDEAFAKAKREDKPIFLSIGYSTCHWCHVMERESFENEEVAKVINEYFVAIKVDREERPDIDNVYMSAVQAMTGSGGWPLTLFLTPDKKPFFGGTYFAPESRWGRSGLLDIMKSAHQSWTTDRKALLTLSNSLTDHLKKSSAGYSDSIELTKDFPQTAYSQYVQRFDSLNGGFGGSPKFPMGHNLSFLLRYAVRDPKSQALEMVKVTLRKMSQGGIYDHLGGGIHRYSTDHLWQIPHFEKMLYDQAITAKVFVEAYQLTKDEYFADVARDIFDYVLRDLQQTKGGFYSAEDADSLDPDEYNQEMSVDPSQNLEKKEGAFYLWRYDEVMGLLGKESGAIFAYRYGIRPGGNAKSDPHNEFTGKNIVFVDKSLSQTARYFKLPEKSIDLVLSKGRKKLFEHRQSRIRSFLDDKILVDWNGLMISALAFGGNVLNEKRYVDAAAEAALFIKNNLINEDGRLLHRYRDGDASILATVDDYAFYIYGLLDLYEATFDGQYLMLANDLQRKMATLFWDAKRGGFFFAGRDAEDLLFEQKEVYDGALPSGNSVAALNLIRLYSLTLSDQWRGYAQKIFEVFGQSLMNSPSAHAQMLIAFDFFLGPSKEIVIAGQAKEKGVVAMQRAIQEFFIPNKVILLNDSKAKNYNEIITLAPFMKTQLPIEGKPTAYVCENHVCQLPTNDVEKLKKLLVQ